MRFGVKAEGTNALLRMLDFDNFEGAKLLLDYGADPNETVTGHPSGQAVPKIPALHHAARRGRDGRFADLLLQLGAHGNAVWQGCTAYAVAMLYGNQSFARALAFEAGAPLLQTAIDGAMDERMVAFLTDWADNHRDKIVSPPER